MSDLPHAQPIYNDDDVNHDGASVAPSGSFGEKAPVESSFSPEISKPQEILKNPESIPIPNPPQIDPVKKDLPLNTVADTQHVTKKVVDKTDQITTLHEIDDTRDKLTKEADDEEEHFIEEVEKHHGNL